MIENPQHFNLITNFEEITSRPNFVEKVTIARGEDVQNIISDLVGFYVLRDFVSCGISSCGRKHQKGYIAALHDGNEIIIGHKCGKKHFGVTFDEKAKQFKHLRDNANQYLQIKAMFEKLPQLKESLERILNQSGKMTFLQIKMAVKSFKEDAFDYWMRRKIGQEVSSNGSIYIDDFKTEEEINAEILSGRKNISDIKRVLVANIAEYDVIANWHNAERLKDYFDRLYREIKNPNQMEGVALKALAKKLRQHDQNLRELEDYIKRGNRLFVPENLIQLAVLFTKPHEQKIIEKYANNFA
ncbi:hypothetical protein VXG46_001306 [Acinetobacter baumannii]|nr:hypothetical protein [Acinetobacter baumannii]EMD9692172.1 hypothetical protein [Acinetobacter baumannii]